MDSDNSDGEVDRHGLVNHANKNINDTSDVSDDENISHAARSIESPPESPQQAGHYESPPVSPQSYNKEGRSTPSSPRSPEEPRSPRSPEEPRSPRSPEEPLSPDRRRMSSPDFRRSDESTSSRGGSPRTPGRAKTPPELAGSPESYHSPMPGQFTPPSPRSLDDEGSPPRHRSPPGRPRSPEGEPESPDRRDDWSPNRDPHSPYSDSRGVPRTPPSPRSPRSPQNERSPYNSPSSRNVINSPHNHCFGSPENILKKESNCSDINSEDGNSNMSSESIKNSNRRVSPVVCTDKTVSSSFKKTGVELRDHTEDLSDVSDLGSLGSVSDDEEDKKDNNFQFENGDRKNHIQSKATVDGNKEEKKDHCRIIPSAGALDGDDGEALDFEPGEDKEEGECGGEGQGSTAAKSDDEGEIKGEELEEGELSDEGENRPEETEPRPICRFYNRGQCTWGSQCRFVHPGVTDKGNYTMFEMVRPLVPVNGPPQTPTVYPADYRPVERPVTHVPAVVPPVAAYTHPRKEETSVVESAWERGLRQAKEMLRKSTKRKETEVDFEEKKMNLTLSHEELEKENDLYLTRSASPILNEEQPIDRWSAKVDDGRKYRTVSDRFEDYGGGAEYAYHSTGRDWYHRGAAHYDIPHTHLVRESEYLQGSRSKYHSAAAGGYPSHHRAAVPPEYYEQRRKHKQYPPREVIVQRQEREKSSWKEDSPPPTRSSRHIESGRERERASGARADDWADPWMRSKSPIGPRKGRTRKPSYSTGSSYSSSSRSSRSSSYSSNSRDSQSRSHSSRSRSRSHKIKSPSRRLRAISPFNRNSTAKVSSPALMPDKWATSERALHMNPPPPSPRKTRGPTSPSVARRNPTPPDRRGGVPARLLAHSKAAVAAAMRSARSGSKSSRSSSGSDSSGSSSDSSESSLSSSSSSRGPSPSPPVRSKRLVLDDRLALAQAAMKVKAMDALKLSGQKQQIKLTLKGSANAERPPPSVVIGKKRPLESSPPFTEEDSPKGTGGKLAQKKAAPSRREELLKQLKAVEDAIARKRSKIM